MSHKAQGRCRKHSQRGISVAVAHGGSRGMARKLCVACLAFLQFCENICCLAGGNSPPALLIVRAKCGRPEPHSTRFVVNRFSQNPCCRVAVLPHLRRPPADNQTQAAPWPDVLLPLRHDQVAPGQFPPPLMAALERRLSRYTGKGRYPRLSFVRSSKVVDAGLRRHDGAASIPCGSLKGAWCKRPAGSGERIGRFMQWQGSPRCGFLRCQKMVQA
jgi:hypothetical protein